MGKKKTAKIGQKRKGASKRLNTVIGTAIERKYGRVKVGKSSASLAEKVAKANNEIKKMGNKLRLGVNNAHVRNMKKSWKGGALNQYTKAAMRLGVNRVTAAKALLGRDPVEDPRVMTGFKRSQAAREVKAGNKSALDAHNMKKCGPGKEHVKAYGRSAYTVKVPASKVHGYCRKKRAS